MADLVARVLAIESYVNEIKSIVTGHYVSNEKRPRNTRNHARRGNQDITAPPWAAKIVHILAKLSADVQDVKREIHNGSLDSGHGKNGDEVSLELGLPASSQQGDRDEDQPESPPSPARESSQTVGGPSILSQSATEQPTTKQNTPPSPRSADSIISPRPDTESPIQHGRDSSKDTSPSYRSSTLTSRSSSPPTDESSISETASSRDVNEGESTEQDSSSTYASERLSQQEPVSTVSSPDDSGLSSAPTICCTFVDFFNHDEEIFDQICRDQRMQEYGYVQLEISDLPSLNMDEDSIKHPAEDHAVHFCYERDNGSVMVNQSSKRRFKLPKFPLSETAEKTWSRAKLKAFVQATLETPPKEAVYIIGEQTFPYAMLSPGEKLKRRGGGNLPGVNMPYQYFSVSGGPTITIFHCEDARLGSKNVVLDGENKVLVVVKPSSNKNFEDRMYERFPRAKRDSQGIRHLARAIPPSLLDEWGVEYDIAGLAPGQGFATLPGNVYHMVINMGDNLALAVNWEQASSPDMPEGYVWCNRRCDPRAIAADDFRLSDHPPAVPQKANVTRKRKREASPAGRKTPRTMLKNHKVHNQVDKPRALKEFVLSTKAIAQHMARTHAFRSWDTEMKNKLRSSRTASADEIDGLIQACEGGELLQRFLKRLMQVQQERRIKVHMKTHNLKRASSDIIEDMLGWRRWPDTEEYRKKLRKEREQSKKLERICSGKYRGLLCFLPHEDSPLDLAEQDIQKFLLLVRRDDIVATLCKLGTDFEDSILGDKEVPVYVLEDKGLAELEQLSLEARAALLTQT